LINLRRRMGTFEQYMTEVFDSKKGIEFGGIENDPWYYVQDFAVNGRKLTFQATKFGDGDWRIEFSDWREGSKGHKILKTGDAFKVFTAVIQIVKKWIKQRKPKSSRFSATEPSRIKLYDKFAKHMQRAIGYKLKERIGPEYEEDGVLWEFEK